MTYEKKIETLDEVSKVLRHSIFPVNVDINNLKDHVIYQGLTKREYFAAMAMQGILSGAQYLDNYELFAKHAVAAADALIAELNK